MSRKFRIAIYMRLSKGDQAVRNFPLGDEGSHEEAFQEDIGGNESNSIRMQRRLLKEFVAAHFKVYELLEFEDDGYSGTNFSRPGVSRLLEMVRNMEIDCIVVKDFSRFSRDYIELGAYLEQIFPFMGVRFISVNDGYDSADKRYASGELDISFKNLLYDLYSKDLSVKVKSALSVRKERGQYISSNSPFGYKKSPGDRHMLLVAEDEAAVVRRIFDLALQGFSSGDIARIFNRERVKTPMQFRVEKGETGRSPKKGIYIWQASTVCKILHNQVYVGDIVYGKTEKENVGGKNRLKPQSAWKIYTDHHAPIIDRHVFQILQERREAARNQRSHRDQLCGAAGSGDFDPRSTRQMDKDPSVSDASAWLIACGNQSGQALQLSNEKGAPHPLTGKLVCGCCGRNLCLRKMAAPCFVCPYKYVNPLDGCVGKVNAHDLECYVLSEMQARVLQMEGEENIKVKCREAAEKKREEWQRKRRQLQREETLLKRQRVEIYEVSAARGKNFNANQAMTGNFADRENFLKTGLAEMEKKEMTVKVNIAEAEEKIAYWGQIIEGEMETADMMSCMGLADMTGRNVSEMIDRIVVSSGENLPQIEIHWIEWESVRLFQHLCDTGGN